MTRSKIRCWLVRALLVLSLAAGPVAADRWSSPDRSVSLEFRGDGTFVYQDAERRFEGRYAEQGGRLVLVAPDGSSTAYRVDRLSEGHIALVDGWGATYHFLRTEDDPVLLRAGDRVLRTQDFEVGCTLASLLIDRPLTGAERSRLLDAARRDFTADPAGFLARVEGIRRAIEPILATGDPLAIVRMQQALVAEVHLESRRVPVELRPEIARLMDENVRVLAVDEGVRLVLTGQAVDAFLALGDRAAGISGRAPLSASVDRAELERALAEAFHGMSAEEKRGLCGLPVVWRIVEHNWSRMGDAGRARLAEALGFDSKRVEPTVGEGATNEPEGSGASLLEMQADAWHRQQMFDMMSSMSLEQHATSLNIIENMGGTADYWQVVDRP